MNEGDWITAKEAAERLKNYSDDPRALLLSFLREGSVSARAALIRRQGVAVERAPFLRKDGRIADRFWATVTSGDWLCGIFSSIEAAHSKLFEPGELLQWSAHKVELNWVEVLKQVGPLPTIVEKNRAPSVKSARPPTDEQILAKADAMKALGKNGRDIAKEMRFEPGFENVPNQTVRDLLNGRYPKGRPKNAP